MDIRGKFILPDKSEFVFGNIRNIDGKIILEVMDGLNDLMDCKSFEVINGYTTEGEITLINCSWSGSSYSGCYQRETYIVNGVIIGKQYSKIEDIQIKEITTQCDYLNDFLAESHFTIIRDGKMNETTFKNKVFDTKEYELREYIVNFECIHNIHGDGLNDFKFEQLSNIRLKFNSLVDFYSGLDEQDRFAYFLTFCIGKVSKSNKFKIVDKDDVEVNLIFGERLLKKENFRAKIPLIVFKNIEMNFNKIYSNWIENKEKLEPIVKTIFMLEGRENQPYVSQIDFTRMISVLETFYGRFKNHKEEKEKFKKRVDSILAQIENEDDKNLVKDNIQYKYEQPLRKKLKLFFKDIEILQKFTNKQREKIANKILNTRDYYTHFGGDENDILSVKDSFYLYRYIKLGIRVLVFKELGVKESEFNIKKMGFGEDYIIYKVQKIIENLE